MKITHDFHIHTHLSSCANENATVKHYVEKASDLGLKKIGFSDHIWDASIDGANNWYKKQNYDHLQKLREEIVDVSTQDIQIYFGCETEYDLIHNDVAISKKIAKKFDFLLVPNSHTHITMPKEYYYPYQKHADFMIKAFYDIMNSNVSKYITAIAHPFFAVGCQYDNRELFKLISDSEFENCFKTTKERNIALEINISCFKNQNLASIYEDPSLRMYHIAKECGCKFIVGSDSHSNLGHDRFEIIYAITSILSLNDNDFLDIVR